MAIRTALIGTGNCGSLALKQLVSDARFDLTGVWVSSDAKVGKDAGELAGLDVTTGVAASDDLDAIIAAKPECIVYCAMGDTRLPDAMADVRKILAAGVSPREARVRAMVMLRRLGLEARAKHLPHQLSTGERQRVGIARALLNEPKVILADEPTGNLDSERTEMILDLLAAACAERGVAVLLVTHDPRAAAYADRVLRFADGKIEPAASESPHASADDDAIATSP